jgi:hypothetical protein
MKDRTVWAFLAFALLVLGGIYLLRNRSAPPMAPAAVVTATPAPAGNPAPQTIATPTPVRATDTGPMLQLGHGGQKIPIEDGKSIDLSSGRPVVRDDARSRAAIEKSLREMEEAARSVTFQTIPSQVVIEKKKEEPAPPAPKP